jgi:hypothetical protein
MLSGFRGNCKRPTPLSFKFHEMPKSPSERSTAQALLEPMATIPLDRRLEIFRAFPRNLDCFPRVLLDGWSWSFREFSFRSIFGDSSLSISRCPNSVLTRVKPHAPFLDLTAHDKSTLLPRSFCHPFYPSVRLPRD